MLRYFKILFLGFGFVLITFSNLALLYPLKASVVDEDTWIDEDGDTAISINDLQLSIYSMNNFFYFDEIFSAVLDKRKIRLCIGPTGGAGIAENCFENLFVSPASYSRGKNSNLSFSIDNHQQEFQAFKSSLRAGNAMKVSIDNYHIYASYTLHNEHYLDPEFEDMLNWRK